MNFSITKTRKFLNANYIIQIDDRLRLTAVRLLEFFGNRIVLKDQNEIILAEIKKKLAFFKFIFKIDIPGKPLTEFKKVSLWKKEYVCHFEGIHYELIRHNRKSCSIYKNGQAIAQWERESKIFSSTELFHFDCEDNLDYVIISCFFLIIDMERDAKKGKAGNN